MLSIRNRLSLVDTIEQINNEFSRLGFSDHISAHSVEGEPTRVDVWDGTYNETLPVNDVRGALQGLNDCESLAHLWDAMGAE